MHLRDPKKLFPHDHVMRHTIIPLIPKWISPNMVTIFRIILTPFVLWFLFQENFAVGVPLFLFTAFTDVIDGSLARIRKDITDWGTFYDPLADKLLIGLVVLLIVVKHVNLIFGLVIIIIEAAIILGGYIRKQRGTLQGANILGKTKMFFQVLGVSFLLVALWAGVSLFIPVSVGTLSLAIVLAVISLFSYGI